MAVQTQIQTRRGTAASWTSTNPTLAAGEIGFETDTGKFKIGNGSTAWASLSYNTNGATASPLTTKGDLFTYSTTNARLAVGNNGESLVADSSTATGLRYQGSTAAGRNFLINGGFDIWQRSTSATLVTVGSYIAPDRMACTSDSGGNGTASQVTSSLPTGFRYGLKLQRTAGNTSVGIISVAQFLETSNSIPLAGQTVTVSFWAKAGANFSAGSSALLVRGFTGTGTDQTGGFGTWTGYAEPISANPLITTSWVRYSVTGTLASTATQFGIRIGYTPSGTAGADDSFQITGMQVEIGSVATNFTRAGGTIQGELSAATRYYWRQTSATASDNYYTFNTGFASSSTNLWTNIWFPTPMRTAPSFASSAANTFSIFNGGSVAVTGVALGRSGVTSASVAVTVASGLTGGAGGTLEANNNKTSFLEFSAEL